jgi:ParB family chromosome partitioning protein
MIAEIRIGDISFNPYNPRSTYSRLSIERIAQSMRRDGQLSLVRVRPGSTPEHKYELIYGHRRFLAAKYLGWDTIRAEIVEASEEAMITQSLIENVQREDLSDYDKALIFERLHREFHKTLEEIGDLVGISKSHVCNYLGMLNLFLPETLACDAEIRYSLQQLSEHHARILSRITDYDARIDLAKLTVKNKLTVKELTNLVVRLRSWFKDTGNREQKESTTPHILSRREDEQTITRILFGEFQFPDEGKFHAFEELHLFGEGFTIYDDFPPFDRFEKNQARSKEREWFFKIAPNLHSEVKDLKIDVLGQVAIATLSVRYSGTILGRPLKMKSRGTVVLVKKKGTWKIFHEHWSRLDLDDKVTPIIVQSSPIDACSED